jgi:hypothetical protein
MESPHENRMKPVVSSGFPASQQQLYGICKRVYKYDDERLEAARNTGGRL